MADDSTYRGYRANEPFKRAQSGTAPSNPPARTSDPLAELARLIGQNDPFADPGPADPGHAHHPAALEPRSEQHWRAPEPAAPDHRPTAEPETPDHWRPAEPETPLHWRTAEPETPLHWRAAEPQTPDQWGPTDTAPTAYVNPPSELEARSPQYPADDPYQPAEPAPAYPPMPDPGMAPPRYESPAYGEQHYEPAAPVQPAYEHAAYSAVPPEAPGYTGYAPDPYYSDEARMPAPGEGLYDDTPAPRRRSGLAIALALIGLAIAGSIAAYGYRTYFSGPHGSKPPPVIHADTAPKKVVPTQQTASQQPAKAINDRLAPGEGEKMISREEKPLDVKSSTAPPPPKVVLPIPIKNGAPVRAITGADTSALVPPMQPSATIGEPKRVHTVIIRPDHPPAGSAPAWPSPQAPTAQPKAAPAPAARAKIASPPLAAPRAASTQPSVSVDLTPAKPREASPQRTQRASRPVTRSARSGNAPLSLVPQGSPATTARAAAPARIHSAPRLAAAPSAPAPQATATRGGYAVQVSSRRSESDARASFRALQARFPNQLRGRTPIIRRANLGSRGIYYRALVGPFATAQAASSLCSQLKAAGGSCIVQRN